MRKVTKIVTLREKPLASGSLSPAALFTCLPIQSTLAPHVEKADQQDYQENAHLDQAEELELAQNHRPRIKKDDLDIKQDKEDGDDVVLDRKAAAGIGVG